MLSLRRLLPRPGLRSVKIHIALTWVLAAASWLTLMVGQDPVADSTEVSWVIALIAFIVVEKWVVNMHFRTEGGSFSFFEIPMVLGVLFVDPTMLIPSVVIGSGLVLHLHLKRPPIKTAFNTANFALRVTMAWALLDVLLGSTDPLSPVGWLVILSVSIVTSLIELSNIWLVVSLAEGSFRPQTLGRMLFFGMVVASVNTVQAVLMALLYVVQPLSLLLLASSTVVLFVAYRSYMSERDQRERVEFLYSSTRALKSANDIVESAGATLLEEAAGMFRAEIVELHLPGEHPNDGASIGRILRFDRTGFSVRDMTHDELETLSAIREAATPPLIVGDHGELARYVAARGFRDAMLAALSAGENRVGLLLVADRIGNVSTFLPEDLQLFEALSQHAGLTLENDQLGQALGQLRQLERELAHQASHDALTGLANRALLGRRLDELLVDQPDGLALLYVDLDDFKDVNDTLGHAAGDAVLVEAARRLRRCVRPTDIVARLGGDEFAVLLAHNPHPYDVARRILNDLNEPYRVVVDGEERTARVGASAGLARWNQMLDAAELISHADVAMYSAKEMGKGSVAVFRSEMHERASARQTLRSQLRTAVSDEQFRVLYQPIVDVRTGEIVAAEALVRWVSPDGLLLPNGFIDEAERSGLIVPIDSYVFSQVLTDIPRFDAVVDHELWLTSNLSMRTLQEADLVDRISSQLDGSGVEAPRLVLEVTETALMHEPELATRRLNELRAEGMRVALDDFGTGYSSLSYLRRFPLDILKIAQPFVTDLENGDDTFVRAIVDLGHTLGLDVLAEGIEREATLRRLRRLGCEYGQGYYFARPLPVEEFLKILAMPKREAFGSFERATSLR